jgi:hypothetical protein
MPPSKKKAKPKKTKRRVVAIRLEDVGGFSSDKSGWIVVEEGKFPLSVRQVKIINASFLERPAKAEEVETAWDMFEVWKDDQDVIQEDIFPLPKDDEVTRLVHLCFCDDNPEVEPDNTE